MQISTISHLPRASRPAAASEPAPKPADTPPNDTPPDSTAQQIVDKLVSSPEFTKKALNKLGKGDQLTITVNGEDVVKIKNEGPGATEKLIKGAQSVLTAASSEAARVVQADPAFAFKEAAMGVRTQVSSGIPSEASSVIENAFLPMLRVVALALDGKKAVDAFKNKDASTMDKVVDGAHVLTDVAGVVGALGYNMVPALNGLAGPLTAVGLAGDIAAYSYHILQYLRERGQVNFDEQQQQAPPPQSQPAPAPAQPALISANA